MAPLKTIRYRGGIANFEIPASWLEEFEPSGGGTFYEDRTDSGTLRLNVLSFTSNGKESGEEMVAGMISRSGYAEMHDGLAIMQEVESTDYDGEALCIHYWRIAIPVEDCSARLAIFSYTILASQADDLAMQQEIELLDRCIRHATFSRVAGVSGDDPVQ